ncbi:MAG: hypothetical protein O7E57_09110, partial [Gammaproteobacteria bacterium]|nr:hypothetical protein [Gammaproteobacteria bacterium]
VRESMEGQEGLVEIVVLFEEDGLSVHSEILFSEFEALAGASTVTEVTSLDRFSGQAAKAVFVVVGAGLTVQAMVFFQFQVDINGRVEEGFNLPLRYLVEQAGRGPDLGMGAVRLASRAQCPVPWHATKLWEPRGQGEENSVMLAQKAVWRNRLSLKATGMVVPSEAGVELIAYGEEGSSDEQPARVNLSMDAGVEWRANGKGVSSGKKQHTFKNKLTASFGEDGKIEVKNLVRPPSDQLAKISEKYRADLQEQQQTYLNQIRGHRDEIQKLKSQLRNEQERSRRLQAMLRGES